MFRTFEQLIRLLLTIILVIWILGIIILFFWISTLIFSQQWRIPFSMLGCIIGLVSGMYLYVILTIPYFLSKEFDSIKNKVSQNLFASVDEFQKEVADFLIKFFRFPGANIVGGVFQFKEAKQLKVNIELPDSELEENSMSKISILTLSDKKKLLYVPVHLGNEKLGDMFLLMNGFILPIFKIIISDFENYYLDDQLMHVINYQKLNKTKSSNK